MEFIRSQENSLCNYAIVKTNRILVTHNFHPSNFQYLKRLNPQAVRTLNFQMPWQFNVFYAAKNDGVVRLYFYQKTLLTSNNFMTSGLPTMDLFCDLVGKIYVSEIRIFSHVYLLMDFCSSEKTNSLVKGWWTPEMPSRGWFVFHGLYSLLKSNVLQVQTCIQSVFSVLLVVNL